MGAGPDTYPLIGNEIHVPIDVAQQDYLNRYQRIKAAGGRYVPGTPGNSGQVATPGGIQQRGGQGGAVKVTNAQQYQQLPSGTVYTDPQGNTRRKP